MFGKVEVFSETGDFVGIEDNRTVENTKKLMNEMINIYREERLAYGMWYMGYFWETDERARTNLTATVTAVNAGITLPSNFTWRDNNNNNVPMNAQQLVIFSGYLILYINSVYTYSWYLKTLVDACTTLEELDAINIYSGWHDGNMDGTMPTS